MKIDITVTTETERGATDQKNIDLITKTSIIETTQPLLKRRGQARQLETQRLQLKKQKKQMTKKTRLLKETLKKTTKKIRKTESQGSREKKETTIIKTTTTTNFIRTSLTKKITETTESKIRRLSPLCLSLSLMVQSKLTREKD